MKAQARKILALIMAMVMCLSLAAPAFAASEEAPEAPEASTSAEVETEAPEAEEDAEEPKAEKKDDEEELKEQADVPVANTYANAIEISGTGTTFTVKGGADGTAANVLGTGTFGQTDTYPVYVDVVPTTVTNAFHVGGPKTQTKYVVTVKSQYVYAGKTAAAKEITLADDADSNVYTLEDESIAWTAMTTGTGDWYHDSTDASYENRRVSGFYYVEKQDNGKYNTYFKLAKYDSGNKFKKIDVAKGDVVWAVSVDGTKAAPTMSDVLKTAETCNKKGQTTGDSLRVDGTATYVFSATPGVAKVYSYTTLPTSLVNVVTDSFEVVALDGQNQVGSFKVRATYYDGSNNVAETEGEELKAALEDVSTDWEITSFSSTPDSEGYFSVSIKKTVASSAITTYKGNASAANNTLKFGSYVVLDNVGADGKYTGASGEATITAGYKLAGPVAVEKKELDKIEDLTVTTSGYLNTTDNWYYFDSVNGMLSAITNADCGNSKTIPYVQLNVYGHKDASTAAPGVTVSGDTVTAYTGVGLSAAGWATITGADVTTGLTATKKANPSHTYATTVVVKDETCGEEGSVTTTDSCIKCGKIKSTNVVTIPKDQSNLVADTKENGYALTSTKKLYSNYIYDTYAEAQSNASTLFANYSLSTYYNDVGPTYGAEMDANTGKWRAVATLTRDTIGLPSHYLAEATTTITKSDKNTVGTSVTVYKCNYGVVHDNFTTSVEIPKAELQPAGEWTYIDWGTQNAMYARSYQDVFGWSPVIADVDVEYTTTPIDATKSTFGSLLPGGTVDYKYTAVKSYVVYTKDANGKVVTTGIDSHYQVIAGIENIKYGEKDCVDGSANIKIRVYKLATSTTDITTAAKLETELKKGNATLVNTFEKTVVIPAEKTHVDANSDGLCDNCGTAIEQGTVEPVTGLVDISKATVTFKALTYTGKVAQPTVTVTLDGVKLAKSVDYEVEEMQDVNAGTYPLIVKGKGDFTGRVVGNVTINKAKQPMTVKATAPSAKKLKKKAQKVGLTIKKAQGKVTVKVSGPASVKGTTVTAKKGTKKGKKIKITVTAAGNDNYKKGSKTVTVKVKA